MDASEQKSGRLLIGDLVLDTGKRQVSRDGKVLEVPRLSYQLILTLAEAAPNVVTQQELVERIWPGRIVSPETITQRVKLVRQALGDDAGSPRYVGLVRGQGYRMLAQVEELPAESDSLPKGLVAELGRRRVLQTALIYAAAAWSLTEVVSFLIDAIPVFPSWSKALIAILFVVGFPVAMFLAWRFDICSKGIRRTQAASTEGRLTIAAALLLLIGATAGLFYLIYPKVAAPPPQVAAEPGVPAPNTIAVLPFANASAFEEDRYMSEGLGDELRDQLGRVGGMLVAARSSSIIFEDLNADAKDISDRLGVAKLVEGTIRRQGETLRITVQIIDGQTGFQAWTRSYNKETGDMLSIQQEIAVDVVAQMLPEVDPAVAIAASATIDANANEFMWLGRYYYQQVKDDRAVDLPKLLRAIDYYRRATEADPTSALAQSRLGEALLYMGDVQAAEEPIFEAMRLNSELSEVQNTLGLYYWLTFQPGGGVAHYKAIQLNPNNADALTAYGKWLWHQGITDASESYLLRAIEIDPLSLSRYADLGNFYGVSGKREAALRLVKQIEARFEGAAAYLDIARIYEIIGDFDVAIAWAMRAGAVDPNYPDAGWMLSELYARIGDFEAARYYQSEFAFAPLYWERRYDEMIDLADELVIDQPNQVQIWFGLGRALVATGQYDRAIFVLQRQNLPENVYVDSRRANGQEALTTLADALNESGQPERAREYATWVVNHTSRLAVTGAQKAWWPKLYEACARSILGEDEIALDRLEKVVDSPGLLWYPLLVDSPCFRKFENEPRYRAVVAAIDKRMKDMRDKVPLTLQQFQLPP